MAVIDAAKKIHGIVDLFFSTAGFVFATAGSLFLFFIVVLVFFPILTKKKHLPNLMNGAGPA